MFRLVKAAQKSQGVKLWQRGAATHNRSKFVVQPSIYSPLSFSPVPRPEAPKISARSSRVRGRRSRAFKYLTSIVEGETVAPNLQPKQQVYLPSVFMRLVRNVYPYINDPYTATFRTDVRLTKPDITNYLRNIYGLEITAIRTMNYLGKLKRKGSSWKRSSAKKYKKVLVRMVEPFKYPAERPRAWLNQYFQRDMQDAALIDKLGRLGDSTQYNSSGPFYRGATPDPVHLETLKTMYSGGDLEEVPNDKPHNKLRHGLRKRSNVMRSRAEKDHARQAAIQKQAEELKNYW